MRKNKKLQQWALTKIHEYLPWTKIMSINTLFVESLEASPTHCLIFLSLHIPNKNDCHITQSLPLYSGRPPHFIFHLQYIKHWSKIATDEASRRRRCSQKSPPQNSRNCHDCSSQVWATGIWSPHSLNC